MVEVSFSFSHERERMSNERRALALLPIADRLGSAPASSFHPHLEIDRIGRKALAHDSIERPSDSFQALFLCGADYCKREEEEERKKKLNINPDYPPQLSVISCCSSQTCWIGNLNLFIGERPVTGDPKNVARPGNQLSPQRCPRPRACASPGGRDTGSRL